MEEALVDRYGRVHTDLRISVTDRCNIRCFYCMPAAGAEFKPHTAILTFEEFERVVRIAAGLGIRKLRVTGGEPLVRKDVVGLVRRLAAVPGIEDLAMTTNGILLAEHAQDLAAAGLKRVNISLDTLDAQKFHEISRRDELPRVLAGIAAACGAGFRQVKLNTVAVRGQTEDDAIALAHFARDLGLELRFIEFMPADGKDAWTRDKVLSGREILALLGEGIGPLEPIVEQESSAPATRYRFADGRGSIGLISTVSQPFCSRCSRLRLSAEGMLRNCIFSKRNWDLRALLRGGAHEERIIELIRSAVAAKKPQHGEDSGHLTPTDHAMHQIGG